MANLIFTEYEKALLKIIQDDIHILNEQSLDLISKIDCTNNTAELNEYFDKMNKVSGNIRSRSLERDSLINAARQRMQI